MERITPEQVVEAYKATGLKPVKGIDHGYDCACALVTLFALANDMKMVNCMKASSAIGLEDHYGAGFIHGWDGDGVGYGSDAYTDGSTAWQAVVNAGLVTVSEQAVTDNTRVSSEQTIKESWVSP